MKKVINDKINVIPFLVMTIFIVFIYLGNHKSAYVNITDPMLSGESELEVLKEDVMRFEMEMNSFTALSEDYKISSENLNMANNRLHYMQGKLDAIKSMDWNEYYKNDSELTKITIKVLEESTGYEDEGVIETLKISDKYDQYMAVHNLDFDSHFTNTQGISYMSKVMNDFFPIMIAIFLIFITSKMYCSSYIGTLDIQNVLPYSSLKKHRIRLFSGTLIGIFILLFVSTISMISGTIGNTFGSFSSPILSYNIHGANEFVSLQSMIPQTMILVFLSILFITNFVSVISCITRKNMTCLLVSLAIIIGFLFISQNLAPLQEYIHLFPTTYLNSLKVVSGELTNTSKNVFANFTNGVIILLISNLILFTLYYYLPKIRFRRIKTKRKNTLNYYAKE